MNRLYFGDNLKWLSDRKEFPDASVDLVYLDPPFNSNADYNVLFREPSGAVSQAQFHAFTDTWSRPRHRHLPSVHRQLPERRCRRTDGGAAQFSETFTDDGLSGDDGAAPRRASSRPQTNRQSLSALRSDGGSLFADVVGWNFRCGEFSATRLFGNEELE